MIFFTSDTHFNDPRILRLDPRPFSSLAAHDQALTELWNETIAPSDEVWHLGDFARGSAETVSSLLSCLHGTKHLIIGNNDGVVTLRASAWASVQHYKELTVEGRFLVLCHYPFRTWNQIGKKSINLHGHSHGRLKPMTRQHDVGVDAWDFRPVTFAAIQARRRRRG
ncbi:metallophosphoesterase family protein [Mesorhizobium sp. L2C084A000]|uniref:metallophosphoesterase family protein n=1 Tax=unclassified Mesorhizobium TaxID=325217 RepID=UPI0003CFAF0C|nr:metallophosphoesterase family protein [Mesorhizobium sp. L2C084A000]ESZ24799.1 hydrolase [Mesorhizobium sp. L2C084A000]